MIEGKERNLEYYYILTGVLLHTYWSSVTYLLEYYYILTGVLLHTYWMSFILYFSGFIFLRLLCPAILNPKSFNLITGTYWNCLVDFYSIIFQLEIIFISVLLFLFFFRNTIRSGLSHIKTYCQSITKLGKFSGIWN